MFFQNQHLAFLRKPHNIPSTRWKTESFLEQVFLQGKTSWTWERWSWESLDLEFADSILDLHSQRWITQWNNLNTWVNHQQEMFTDQQEYGLLNRLDTPTAWLLYFANTSEVYEQRKSWQQAGRIQKYYIARSEWTQKPHVIDRPLAHHTNGKNMLVVDDALISSRRKQKMKGKPLPAQTKIIETIHRNDSSSTLLIQINKGRRHQIRVHLAHADTPIIGDELYWSTQPWPLQLFSVGCLVEDGIE